MNSLALIYKRITKFLSQLDWLPPLLARLSVGYIFAESGWGKIHNVEKVADFFLELMIPAPHFQAYLVAYTELIAGALLLIGLATRLASLPLIITMVVALRTAKAEDIASLSDLFATSEFLYIVLLVWLVIAGPGRLSLDYLIARKTGQKRS